MPVPISYVEMMFNSWEIVGQFMYLREAYQRLLDLIRSGQLDMKRSVRSFIHWLDFARRWRQRLSLATSNALSFNTGSEFYAHLQPIFSALG
jgi:threonine dehydrogenase-like Zn-dependent dehydrogenase